jgi:CBS domain-containing protein
VVDAARVLAVETHYYASANTFDRLRYAADALPKLSEQILDALDAYGFLVDFRLSHQLLQVEAGDPPDNHIDPTQLNPAQQNLLRSVFTAVGALQKALAQHYTGNGSGG